MKITMQIMKMTQEMFDKPSRLLVKVVIRVDGGTDYWVTGWFHLWADSYGHLGLESDLPKFPLYRCCAAVKVWSGKHDVYATDAMWRRLIQKIEKILNHKEINTMPKKRGETRTVAQQLADEKKASKKQESTSAMMSRMAIGTVDAPPVKVVSKTPASVKELPAVEKKAAPKNEERKSEPVVLCKVLFGPRFSMTCGHPVTEEDRYCKRHDPRVRAIRAYNRNASFDNILNSLIASEKGFGSEALAEVNFRELLTSLQPKK